MTFGNFDKFFCPFLRFCANISRSIGRTSIHHALTTTLLLRQTLTSKEIITLSFSLSLPLFFFLSLSHIKRDHPSLILTLSLSLSLSLATAQQNNTYSHNLILSRYLLSHHSHNNTLTHTQTLAVVAVVAAVVVCEKIASIDESD